jgi:hypothetical protein
MTQASNHRTSHTAPPLCPNIPMPYYNRPRVLSPQNHDPGRRGCPRVCGSLTKVGFYRRRATLGSTPTATILPSQRNSTQNPRHVRVLEHWGDAFVTCCRYSVCSDRIIFSRFIFFCTAFTRFSCDPTWELPLAMMPEATLRGSPPFRSLSQD